MIPSDQLALMEAFVEKVEASEDSPETISEIIGGKPSGPQIRKYMAGEIPKKRFSATTLAGMRLFVNGSASNGVRNGARAGAGRDATDRRTPDVAAGLALDKEAMAELYRRVAAIEASGDPGWLIALRTDALASAIRAEAIRQAEAAGHERARAIRFAESAGRERARSIRNGGSGGAGSGTARELTQVPAPPGEAEGSS